MSLWSSEDLGDLYVRLLEAGVEFVVIGGQAVNLWAQHFRARGRLPDAAWAAFEPFASRDLDLLGGSVDAAQAAAALAVEAVFFEPHGRAAPPNSGTLYVPLRGGELIVQFLHSPFGAQREEIRRSARQLDWRGRALPVMHPILCLEAKIECLFGLDQTGRQDRKHVELAMLCGQEFIRDLLGERRERDVLAAIERIVQIALSEGGLRLAAEEALLVESAIPSPELVAHATALPKIAGFLDRRWPQLEAKIATRREHYAQLRARRR